MALGVLVGRVQDGLAEEVLGHAFLLSLASQATARHPTASGGRTPGLPPALCRGHAERTVLSLWKREHKGRLLRGKVHTPEWADTPLPMLGGQTPRQGLVDAEYRARIEQVLRDIEAGEARLPEGQRYDVGILRRQLGLEPPR